MDYNRYGICIKTIYLCNCPFGACQGAVLDEFGACNPVSVISDLSVSLSQPNALVIRLFCYFRLMVESTSDVCKRSCVRLVNDGLQPLRHLYEDDLFV
ncbi:hypothetical protein DPMN_141868 [Dreissena polymorpha]|uniref:Uncharacterized protein n=1 Tax=Dreissena polymorpha TaxID=45954 RepID=A0A9D4JMZ4_DREPO|nr:hypothetical protein DPMN_141868 [Dreissena polymorpha]